MSLTQISSKKTYHSRISNLIKSLAFRRRDDAPVPKASFVVHVVDQSVQPNSISQNINALDYGK